MTDSLLDQLASSLAPCECDDCWCREVAPVLVRVDDEPLLCKDCSRGVHDRLKEEPDS